MLTPKRFLKHFGKRSLSVFLAVVMIMSSMSVSFVTFKPEPMISAEAANGDGVEDFINAVTAYGNAGYKFPKLDPTQTQTDEGKAEWVITNSRSYTPGTYKEYELFRTAITTLSTAIKNLDEYTVCATHNNNNRCGDGYNSSSQSNKCTDWGYVKEALKTTMGSARYNSLKNYNIDNLLDAILHYEGVPTSTSEDGAGGKAGLVRPSNGTANDYATSKKNTDTPDKIWNEFTLNAPEGAAAYIISNSASIAAIPAEYSSKTYIKLGTQRCSANEDNCDGKYHMAIQDQSNKAPSTWAQETNTSIDKSILTDAETAFKSTYANYFATTDKNGVLAISKDETTLLNVKSAIQTAKTNVVNAFGEDVYNKYLGSYAYARTVKNIEDALTFLGFQAIINEIDRLVNIDYSSYNSTQLAGHLAALEEAYASYKNLSDADKTDILANYPDFKPADVEAKIVEINAAYTRLLVVEQVDGIRDHLNAYENKWTMVDVDNDVLTYTQAYAAYLLVDADYNTLKTLDKAVIAEIAGDDFYGRVEALYDHLAYLVTGAHYNELYTPEYKKFNSTIKNAVPTSDVATLLSALQSYDSWYSSLKALIDEMSANLSAEDAKLLFDEMDTVMKGHMDTAYAALNGRVETQINIAYDLYTAHKAIYGPTVHYVSLESYQIVTESIGRIDVPAYEFMKVTPNFEFSAETIRRYEEMEPLVFEYDKFAQNMGFDTFYQYKMADFEREDDPANESFRVNTNKDEDPIGEYITTDAQIEKVIKVIDTALTNSDIAGAIGLDLGTMLTDLVEGAIVSDGFINTVVNLLYPLVLKEFGKVFANDLPKKYSIATITYNKNLHGVFKDAYFEVYPDLLAGVLDSSKYADNIEMLKAAYNNFDKEFGVSTGGLGYTTVNDPAGGTNSNNEPKKILDKTAWDSKEIRNEDGSLKLTWGVDAAKAAGKSNAEVKEIFYQAFDDAVEGLKPLLCALIANESWSATQTKLASAMGQQVDLTLSATANSGYANLLVPIYEALGVPYTSVDTVENVYTKETNDVAYIIKAILEPIFTLVDRIGKAPLDTILGILPNLCYAFQAKMVTPLLSMLKTTIKYVAPVDCALVKEPPSGGVDIDVGTMLEIPILDDINDDGLNALLSLLGLDLAPINQAQVAVMGELTKINSQRKDCVYSIESGKAYHVVANKADVLAYLAEYLLGNLDPILVLLGVKEAPPKEEVPGEEEASDCDCESSCDSSSDTESAEPKEVSPIITELLENLSTNPQAAMAAVVELFNFSEYETKMLYDWFNGTNYEASTVVGFNPATEIYLNVNNDWTREKAEYLYANLETIINAIIAMLPANEEGEDATETVAEGEEVEEAAKTLSSMLDELIGGLFTDETLTSLAAILGKLDLNALLAGDAEEAPAEGEEPAAPAEDEAALDINTLIKDLLGIDLGQFATLYGEIAAAKEADAEYVYNFGVTDAASFVNKLVEMLAPLNKVLDFLLTGGDLTIFDGEAKVTLYGSDGYNTAIIPLLEALGCTPVAATTGSEALEETLNAVLGKLDAIIEKPVEGIFGILPGLVYFLTSNGLSTAAQNLLKPALVVIETIRPIIDVMDIINNIEIGAKDEEAAEGEEAETVAEGEEEAEKQTVGDLFGGELNLRSLDANFVVDLVSNLTKLNLTGLKTIFYDVAAALTVKTYTSASTLQTEWKTATYNPAVENDTDGHFDQADLLTVLLSFVVEWLGVEENATAIDTLLKKEGIGAAISNIIKGAEITYETPNWMYFFDTKEEFLEAVANGMVIPSTLAALQYPNDWNKDTAAYIAEELPELVDMVIGLINNGKTDDKGNALPTTLSALLTDLIGGVFSAKTLNDLIGMITGLLENVADELLAAGGYLLDVDLVNLKAYTASEDIDTIDEFASELASVLTTYAPGIVELLFLGGDYRFLSNSAGKDAIVISGGNGYAEGLALILEALGCENLPAATITEENTTAKIVEGVFASLAARINAILANPVEEILELLPNLIFFLNANGAGVALGNLLKPVNALLNKINALLDKPISIADLIKIKTTDDEGNEVEIALDLEKLALANVVKIVEAATKLDLTVVEDYLVNFCVGKIVSYDSVSVNDAYKMTEFAKEDVITIILTIALIFVQNEDNAAALDELIGTEIISSIKTVFESAPVQYQLPAWYALDWDTVDYEKQTVGVVQSALTYPNDWTADKSLYLADNLAELVDAVIGMIEVNGVKYKSLAALIDANVNIYTPDLFATIQKALGDLLGGLEGDLQNIVNVGFGAADKLLNADIQGLLDYDASGVNDKASFVTALTGMLMEVEGLVEWLLLGKDYELFVDDKNNNGAYDEGEAIITLNGAEGYAQGLSLVLEALGVENLPAATGETEAIVSGVLTAVFDRVDEILANPVDEVIDILPNVIYFINANGLAAAVNNLAGAFNALALKLKTFGLNIALEDLLNIEKLLNITDEEGNVKDLAIGLDNLTLAAVIEVVEEMTGLNLEGVSDIFVDFALGRVQGYTGINGELNAKMVYDEGEAGRFNKGDMITLVVTAALLMLEKEGNAEKINEMAKTDIISAILTVFEDGAVTYATPDWNYMDGIETDDGVIEYVNAIVSYPNDWTEAKAEYLAKNLPALVDTVIGMVEIGGVKYESLAALLQANVNVFTAETLNSLVKLITDLLGDIDAELLEAAGLLLGADINGLKAYTAPETVDTVKEFANELANILSTYAPGVVEWLLLGKDYRFFVNDANNDADYDYGEDIITINGAQGYAEGLALLLEALGCENLPEVYDVENLDTAATVKAVLNSLAARIDEILANPVEEVLDLLPNLIYFLDADGVDAVITNTTAALMALVNKLSVFGIELNINSLVNLPKLMGIEDKYAEGEDKIGLDNLTLVALLRAVSLMTGLDLTELQNVLVPFALGEAKIYDSVSASDAYKMVYKTDLDKHDMLSVIVSAALRMFFAGTETSDKNAAKLDDLLKTNGIVAALKDVFASVEITYATPDWNYMDGIETDDGVIEYVNAIVAYPNDWTEAKAEYLVKNLPALVDTVIGMLEINGKKYESLQKLLSELLADSNIFSAKTLNDLVGLITGLLGDIDASLLEAAGLLLGADIKGLKDYTAPETVDTVEEFAEELANILTTYAKGVVEWLLLGNDYTFFVKEVDENGLPVDFITINGAQGYAEGLALLLEALGCENLPAADGKTEDIVTGVLNSLAARIDEILANPVNEILDLLPNLIYFLDANGVAVVIENTTAALMALINKLSVFGIELDINSLVDLPKLMGIADKYEEDEDKIGLDNLTLVALLRAVSLMTGLDLTELQNVLVPFALGEAVKYDSVSASDAYKMVYRKDKEGNKYDKHDMLSVIVTAALKVVVENEDNAVKLDELLKTNGIVAALKDVFEGSEIIYTTPNWDYCWDKSDEIYDWGNIPVIESAITYPNDWTEEKAQYLAENLPALVDTAIGMIEIDGVKYDSLADLLDAKVNVFTTENLQAIVDLIANLLKDIDDGLLEAAGVLLGADVVGLKAYKAPAGITTVDAFASELANVLNTYAKGVVEWLLLGNDYTFFVKEVDENGLPVDFITINGAQGYAEGLALLLEALGCKNLPAVYGATATTEEIVTGVLASLAARINEIFADPVNEIVNLLPNLIYFLNTNGVAAVIDNTTAAITALAGKLAAFGVNLDLNELVNLKKLMKIEDTDATISLDNLSMKDLLQAVSLMTDLDLTVLEDILVGFAMGHCAVYESVSEASYETFKMVYETNFENHDMITVLVTAVLLVAVENKDNAAKLDEMLGTEIISALKDVFASVEILYTAPNWNYPLADNGTVDAMKYSITYPNNWTEATAEAVTEFLLSEDFDTLITGLIDKNYATLSDLLKAKVNVFTTENLQAIVDLIADLLKDIDDGLLEAAGVLLGADVVGLKAYKAPAGITTVDAFAKELAKVLNTYAKGVVEWLLLGNDYTFFIKDVEIVDEENKIPVDFITINGAHGYAEGLALLLEALGCKNLPAVYGATATTEEIVTGVLASLAARINEIFADPVNEIVDLLPNLFYFLNTNGVAAVVDNTLAAVTALLEKLSVFGLNVDLNELVNLKKLMKIEDTDATISLDNLSMADLLQAVSYMIKDLDITHIKEILVGFALGKVEAYTSVSKEVGETKKMVYATEFDKHDMVTVVANILLITIANEDNAAFVKNLVGEDIYAVIIDILNLSENEVPVKYMDWQGVPDKVGQIFNALETSPNYKGFEYGPLYTEEMAQYIADNIGEFINNIIYLLGLEINGENVDSLEDLLDNLVGGSLYNSDLVITIRDALAGLAGSIEGLEVEGKNVGKLIVKVLAAAEIADLKAIGKVDVPAFEDNREMFVESLCNVLEPAYGLLTWLLADEDLAFFVDLEKNDFITLPGADGYRNGIALLLEAIGCEDLPAELNGEGDAVVKAILNPLLNRLDEIFANPAEEILAVLTNVIYFINSNGVDVVIKNTLNAVYTVLAAIEPVAKVDLYELVGLDAYVTLSAEELIDMLLSKLEVAGFDFTAISVDFFSELTVGKLEAYDSISDQLAAYRMVYDAEYANEADMITAVMRLVITFILTENNREVLINLLKTELGMSADAEKYVRALINSFADVVVGKEGEDLRLGMDTVLATIYYIFYGLDIGVGETADGKKEVSELWQKKLEELNKNASSDETKVGDLITDILDIIFNDEGKVPEGGGNDVLDQNGVASNGFLAFFARIKAFFQEIAEFFRNLFSFGN